MIKLLPFFMLIFLSGCFEYSLSDKKEIIDQRFEGEWTLLDENKKPSSTIRISSVDKYNYKITTKEKNQEVEYVFYVINYEGSNIMQIHLPDNSWLYAEYSISNKNIRIKLADWGLFYDDRGEKITFKDQESFRKYFSTLSKKYIFTKNLDAIKES